MSRFGTQIAQIRSEIAEYGRADAYVTVDGRERNAKIFEVADDGVLRCKEYSGCEFSVHLDDVENLEFGECSPEPAAPVVPEGPRIFTVSATLMPDGTLKFGLSPCALDLAGLPRQGAAAWDEKEQTVHLEAFVTTGREAVAVANASADFQALAAAHLAG